MIDNRVKDLITQGDALFGKRVQIDAMWQEIAENFYPERANFTRPYIWGEDYVSNLTTSYPLIVRRKLGNSLGAMLRPRNMQWASISVDREDRLDKPGTEWLQEKTAVQWRAMYDSASQFVRATKEGDHDFATFGQAVIQTEIDRQQATLLYRCWHLKDTVWTEKYNGTIGALHRKWTPTCRWLCETFPAKVSQSVKDCLEKQPYREINCRHIVVPADEYGEKVRPDLKYWSFYVDIENQTLLEGVAVKRRGYTIPRWQTVGAGCPYAVSPATVAGLPDARLIQAMTLTLLEAGEMAVRPPLIGVQEAIRGDLGVYAGGMTWVDSAYDERMGEVLRPLYQEKSGIPLGVEMNKDTREMLASAFYLNDLTLPPAGNNMTAYETQQRVQEYIRSALPLFEPMEAEYNGALCEATFELLLDNGAFGPMEEIPDSIQGAQVKFKFESPFHEALERQKGQKFLESKQLILEAIQLDPAAGAILDVRATLRDVLEGIKTPEKWLRDEAEVEAHAEQLQMQQQAAAITQQMAAAGDAGKQLGDAKQALGAA